MQMQDLNNKRLLVLGGSIWKDAIKQFADANKITIISAGLYPAGTDDIADEVYRIDTIDENVMIPFIKEKNIDGVYLGGSELIISGACGYVNKLGLPCYCTKEQWDFLQNKANFKQLCISHGLPVVPQYKIDVNNVEGSVPTEAFPVITKPNDGCGSNGFSICHNSEELVDGYKKAAANSPTHTVICEKLVKNDGVGVFYTFSNGNVIFSGSEDKFPVHFKEQGSYVGGLFTFKSKYEDDYLRRFNSKVEMMFQSIGVKEGAIWIELFHDGDNYYFNEVGFRPGGSVSIYPVDYMAGINQLAADLYFALTGESKICGHTSMIPKYFERGLNYAVYPMFVRAGVITEIFGLDNLNDNVVFYTVTKPIGYKMEETGSFGQILVLVHFIYRDKERLIKDIEHLHNTVKVIDANGENMVIKKLDVEKIDL